MVRVINLRTDKPRNNEVLIRCDRASILGSPFWLQPNDPTSRLIVCKQYDTYFKYITGELKQPEYPDSTYAMYLTKITRDPSFQAEFIGELKRIVDISKVSDVALGCWCSPKKCHVDTIFEYVTRHL